MVWLASEDEAEEQVIVQRIFKEKEKRRPPAKGT